MIREAELRSYIVNFFFPYLAGVLSMGLILYLAINGVLLVPRLLIGWALYVLVWQIWERIHAARRIAE